MNIEDIELPRYADWAPTGFDCKGLALDDRQDWLVCPVLITRDTDGQDALAESNYRVTMRELDAADPNGHDHEEHSFNHWGPGWFNIIIVRPESPCHRIVQKIAAGLSEYAVIDDSDYSELECEYADTVWRECYSDAERIEYIRRHRSQFEFHSMTDLMGCVRGKYFCGYASELLY